MCVCPRTCKCSNLRSVCACSHVGTFQLIYGRSLLTCIRSLFSNTFGVPSYCELAHMGDDRWKLLQVLQGFKELTSLELAGNPLASADLEMLSEMIAARSWPLLRCLDLRNVPMEDRARDVVTAVTANCQGLRGYL